MKARNWQADEMEKAIALRALRWAFTFSGVALMVYSACELVATGRLGWPFIICLAQITVFFGANIIMTKRMTKGADDEE